MKSQDFWQIFLETGAPEAYLLYSKALKMKANHVPDDSGVSASCHGLQ